MARQYPRGVCLPIALGCSALLSSFGMTTPVAAQSGAITYLAQPSEGYDAVRFTRRVVLDNYLVRNDAFIQPGATFVSDRLITRDGTPLYCGPISTNGEGTLMTWCFAFDGSNFRSALGGDLGRPIELPTGSFVQRKVLFE